jgi:hypothetical protein
VSETEIANQANAVADFEKTKSQISRILASRSWRITRPMRALMRALARAKGPLFASWPFGR